VNAFGEESAPGPDPDGAARFALLCPHDPQTSLRRRRELQLKPGQELNVYILDGTIRFSKPRSIQELRGIAKGMKWKDDYRDRNDRF
jgi:hypothetical protein